MSQYLPPSKSFPRTIAASIIVINSSGASVVPKGNHRHRNASLYTIDIQY